MQKVCSKSHIREALNKRFSFLFYRRIIAGIKPLAQPLTDHLREVYDTPISFMFVIKKEVSMGTYTIDYDGWIVSYGSSESVSILDRVSAEVDAELGDV